MVRESLRVARVASAHAFLGMVIASSGCSFILDFSDSEIPRDAGADARFTQDECDYKEPNNSIAEAALFATTDVGPAAICASEGTEDHDFYKLTVPSGTASVSVKITFSNAGGDLDLRLHDATGQTLLSQSREFGDEELITCPGTVPSCPMLTEGDYVFEVFPAKTGVMNSYTPALTITPTI